MEVGAVSPLVSIFSSLVPRLLPLKLMALGRVSDSIPFPRMIPVKKLVAL
jgi:hypothetical protein